MIFLANMWPFMCGLPTLSWISSISLAASLSFTHLSRVVSKALLYNWVLLRKKWLASCHSVLLSFFVSSYGNLPVCNRTLISWSHDWLSCMSLIVVQKVGSSSILTWSGYIFSPSVSWIMETKVARASVNWFWVLNMYEYKISLNSCINSPKYYVITQRDRLANSLK